MNMYLIIRRIHLYCAFSILVFLIMYFLTGFLMVRGSWFSNEKPEPIVENRKIDLKEVKDPETLAEYIQKSFDIPGQREQIRQETDGKYRFVYNHPGMTWIATFDPENGQVVLQKQAQNIRHVINTLHRIHSYGGGFIYDLYVIMMDLCSIGLIIFSITGFVLWLKVINNKIWGYLFFFLGISYTLWVIVTFIIW